MSSELTAKYEDWARELVERRAALRGDRRRMRWLLVLGVATAPIGFFWSGLAAFFVLLAWVTVWAVGTYIAVMYDWDYARQLQAARGEIERFRRPEGYDAPPAPIDAWQSQRLPHPGSVRFGPRS